MPDVLTVIDLDVSYGSARAVHGVSLRVGQGESVALLGRNGAGKTSTLAAIAGAERQVAGQILVDGRATEWLLTHQVARLGVALVPQGRRIFPNLSVGENLAVAARDRSRQHEIASQFPILLERSRQRATTLSGGEQQQLAIARALAGRPRLLLMDEPSDGLAPLVVGSLKQLIGSLRELYDTSILIAEQNLALALAVTDRYYILDRGRLVATGASAELAEDEATQRRFLGV